MRICLKAAICLCSLASGAHAYAWQAAPGTTQTTRPTEPGTAGSQISPANKASKPVQAPDVRLDSKPHTDIDSSVDSSPEPPDLGLGANAEIDLGHDIVPSTPAGMLSRSDTDNPHAVFYSLPHHLEGELASEDAATITARQPELLQVAAKQGFDLKQPGWSYAQDVCPATQLNADRLGDVPVGEGSLLLHFRRAESDRTSAFTAIVPRAAGQPVQVVTVAKRSPNTKQKKHELLRAKTDRRAVNGAIPPQALYGDLQPEQGWISTSACLAAFSGASPSIPNEPYLSEDIFTAPSPQLRLLLNGDRKVVFTDRVSDSRFVIWDEHVSRRGRILETKNTTMRIVPRPVTNPPVPATRIITNIPEPPVRIGPIPPSPIAGTKQ